MVGVSTSCASVGLCTSIGMSAAKGNFIDNNVRCTLVNIRPNVILYPQSPTPSVYHLSCKRDNDGKCGGPRVIADDRG